ncbi:MAG: NAD(P)-dependent oxidoreductase [Kiritimatiellia bacterium]
MMKTTGTTRMANSSGRKTPLRAKKTYPLNLFLEGSGVLVAGGGRVGLRKIESLLPSGARVRLVCPECVPELASLAEAGQIEWRPRAFEPADLEGVRLVFACTDSRAVNRRILDAARAAQVLCCCADGNWTQSDFTTPAMIRRGDLLIAVSTNGQSCRRAKAIKQSLAREIDTSGTLSLAAIGVDHTHLSLSKLSTFLPDSNTLSDLAACLKACRSVREFAILSTCNRFELIALADTSALETTLLPRILRLPPEAYILRGPEAFAHLAEVAAGLHSQILGEGHIAAQLKQAFETAAANGWSQAPLKSLADLLLRASKQIRQTSTPLLQVDEIETIALQWLEAHHHPCNQPLVIGAGQLGQALVRLLLDRGKPVAWLYHTRRPQPIPGATLQPISQLPRLPFIPDTVFGATRTPEPIHLNLSGQVPFVDLGLPPNFPPEAHAVGLDQLKDWQRERQGILRQLAPQTARILEPFLADYARLMDELNGASQ